jgi:hypothetical protein
LTQPDFLSALERELRFRGVAFSRAQLMAFVASVWPLAEEDPDMTFWAREFIVEDRAQIDGVWLRPEEARAVVRAIADNVFCSNEALKRANNKTGHATA